MDIGQGVLNAEHLAKINEGIQQIEEAQRQIKLAKQAGVDVSAQEAEAKKTLDSLLRFKQVYFPGQ